MARRSFLALVGPLALAGAALAGCATGTGGVDAVTPTESSATEPSTAPGELEATAAWLDGGASVAVLTWGSSTCLPTLTVADEMPPLDARLSEAADMVCTRDYVLRGGAVPVTVDPSQDLEIRLAHLPVGAAPEEYADGAFPEGTLTGVVNLAGVPELVSGSAPTEGQPSAGWTGEAGVFALSTFGSSSCRPVVQDAAVTAPGEIAVTFVEPPADRVCTMDFGQRVTVVTVEGAEPAAVYEAVLQGDGFAGERVRIAGVPAGA